MVISIKTIFGENGVVGRMGGDEFAAFILKEYAESIDCILEKKRRYIEQFNLTANKPYPIDMSIGF